MTSQYFVAIYSFLSILKGELISWYGSRLGLHNNPRFGYKSRIKFINFQNEKTPH